jgi:DNA polymerase III alpha subunit
MSFAQSFSPYVILVLNNGVRLPEVVVTPEQKIAVGLKPIDSNTTYLKMLAWRGCKKKMAEGKIKQSKEESIARLKMEFEVYEKTGAVDYVFLLLESFGWCDSNNIIRGYGRGSACGSYVLYCLGLTGINPLDYQLSFTRFLSEARTKSKVIDGVMYLDGKMSADFDGDIEQSRRGIMIRHLEEAYPNRTCKISTLRYFTGKTALRYVLRILYDYSQYEAKEITDHIEVVFGKNISLNDTYKNKPEFAKWVDSDKRHKEAFDISVALEGLIAGEGVHASGILRSYYDMDSYMPKQLSKKGVVSGYSMDYALPICTKIDVLGLKTLTFLRICQEKSGVPFNTIDPNDPVIYSYLRGNKEYYGLFQIEKGKTKEATIKIRPCNISHLCAIVAISRPGAMQHIPKFAKYINEGIRDHVHPLVDSILEQSGGILLYQEQITEICQKVYGMSEVDSDKVRYAIGKKKREEMAVWEPVLRENGKKRGIGEEVTQWFWDTCNSSADYLFNLNHSLPYSYLTAATVYYKAKYPKIFYLAALEMVNGLLSMVEKEDEEEGDDEEEEGDDNNGKQDPLKCIFDIRREMGKFNIPLYPPAFGKSKEDYSLEGDGTRMGLCSVKGLSEAGLDKLKTFKVDCANKFELFEALKQAKISLSLITPLVLSGCLGLPEENRNKLLMEVEVYKEMTDRELPYLHKFGAQYNYDLIKIIKALSTELKDEKGKIIIKESRLVTMRKNLAAVFERYKLNEENRELSYWVMETNTLGFAYSTTLKSISSPQINGLMDISEVMDFKPQVSESNNDEQGQSEPDTHVRFAAMVSKVEKRISKNSGKNYIRMDCRDESGTITALIFGDKRISDVCRANAVDDIKKDMIIVINGQKKGDDAVFVDTLTIQENPTVIKKSELKNKGSAPRS